MSNPAHPRSPKSSAPIAGKPALLWAFWRDELSIALEKTFSITYVEPVAGAFPLLNHSLPELLATIDRKGIRPRLFFLHAWILCDSLLGLEKIGIPSAAYLHDAHFHLNSWMWDLSQCFNWVLLDTRESEEYFVRRGSSRTVSYCPLYYKGSRDGASGHLPGGPRPVDVAFVGNMTERLHPGRQEFFRALVERLGTRYRLGGTPSHAFASAFLLGCAAKDRSLRPEAELFGAAPSDAPRLRTEEIEVFREILEGSVLQRPPF